MMVICLLQVLKVTLVILVHRAHLEDLVLRVLRDLLGRKASEVKWVLEALQEVWALLALQVILAQLEQLASVDLLANQEPLVQWAQLDPRGKSAASASVVLLVLLEQLVYVGFLETQVTPDHRDRMASREVQDLLDQQDLKETLDLQVPMASLVILDLLDLLVQRAHLVQ